jgi:hypothetical protein
MTLESKFETGASEPPFDAGTLPWGYGDDRIHALVRSPDSIYVYWEITDEAIAHAKKHLGAAGAHGWCNLRVYDTTGHDFDGTNANGYFDVTVDRDARDYFFDLRRPTASFYVEVGIKTHEGFFQSIARSGRADLPRKEPSPDHSLEWLSVTSDDAQHPATEPYRSKFVPRPAPTPDTRDTHASHHPGESAAPLRAVTPGAHVEERTWSWAHPAHVEVRWEGPSLSESWRAEWRIRLLGRPDGRAAVTLESAPWISGPFTEHMLDASRFEIRLLGDGSTVLEEHSSGLEVFGPWQIAIKGFAREERRTLSAWRVHWVRVERASVEAWWSAFERVRVSAWERTKIVGGASESHVVTEGGASEMWRLGGSERWALGGSEWLAMGASELVWLGASERAWGGASGFLFGGASEALLGSSASFTSPSSPYGWR